MVCCEEAAKVEDVEDDEEELEGWRSGDDGEWDKELDDEDDEVDDEADNQKLQKLAAHVWIFMPSTPVAFLSDVDSLVSEDIMFSFLSFL